MLNPFFLQGSKTEQGLIQDLINEQLRMYGVEVYYLPRKYITEKTVLREVIESVFDNAYPIEAYVDTYEGYSDNPTILSKFGIQSLNEITLTISRERFKNYISPLIKNQPNIKLSSRPKEGDLVFFPFGKRLFEIKYVEHEKPFYQLQGLYTYQLRCELFRYEDEIIDTNITEIDNVLSGSGEGSDSSGKDEESTSLIGNLVNLTMIGVGVTATANATVVNGGVRFVTITNRGKGYTSTPTVGFSSAPAGGLTASAVAEMIGGIVVCNDNTNPQSKSIQKVLVTNSGYGYTVAPGVRFIGGGGKGGIATATIGYGIIGIISITNGGSGYVNPPNISFTGISTISAAATAVVSAAGSISSIYLTNAGLGYTTPPIITISNPALTSTGSFVFGETVTGSQSGTTAKVRSWNSITNVLQVSNLTGEFLLGENIVGAASSASHYLRLINVYPNRDGFASNDEIEEEADEIIDFNESNPFGNP
jgi:hypothetical protein